MSYYTVQSVPLVVGNLHYATIPAQPIEVDADTAAPLVSAGALALYPPAPVPPVAIAEPASDLAGDDPKPATHRRSVRSKPVTES